MTTCFLLPDPIQSKQFIPGGFIPANGGQLFFYLAGTSTKTTVYKDNAAGVAWSNPIVLDSGGDLPLGGEVWVPQGISVKVVFAPAGDSDPPVTPYWTKDDLSGINDISISGAGEWISGPTPTFISATSLRVSGDQRNIFTVGRRLQTVNTAGTRYLTVTSSVFSAGSTNVGANGSVGTMDAGLSAVNYGLLNPNANSVPAMPVVSAYPTFADIVAPTKMVAFNLANLTASTVRSLTFQDSTGTMALVEQLPLYVPQSQCQLQFVDSSHIKLVPMNGNRLAFPNREPLQLPANGISTVAGATFVSGASGALNSSTIYDVYVFATSAVPQFDFHSTLSGNHSTDATSGIEVRGANTTRAYVGKVKTSLTTTFAFTQALATNGTSGAAIGVISWFNRRPIGAITQVDLANNIATQLPTEPSVHPRLDFLTFGQDDMDISIVGSWSATSAAAALTLGFGLDNTSAIYGTQNQISAGIASISLMMGGGGPIVAPAEGNHFVCMLAGCTGNSATGQIGASTTIRTMIRG